MSEYAINKEYKDYVDKYSRDNKITPEEAVEHKIVQNAEEYYRERRLSRG